MKQTSPLCVRLFRKPGAAHLRRVPRSGAQAYFTCCGRSENTGFTQSLRLHPWLLCVALCAAHAAETASPDPARWEIPTNTAAVELVSRAGTNQNKLTVTLADATTRVFSWRAQGSSLTLDLRKNRQAPPDRQTFELPDQSLVLEGPWVGGSRICYARPNLQVYDKTRQLELIEKWTNLPPASTHWMKLLIRLDTHGFETWINGNYAGRFDGPSPVSMALETGTSGAFMTPCFQRADPTADGFIQLDLTRFETSLFKIVSWPWHDGPAHIKNIPFLVNGQNIVDLGRVRHVPATAEERDYYLARSPLDNMRESAHFTVPPNLYARAHLLCFLDDSPGKSSEAIARITRYVFLRGISCDAIMDSHFRLPRNNEPIPEFARQVGEITVARDNATNAVPLFLVSLPLRTGAIADLVFQPHDSPLLRKEAGLDFELVGPTQKPRYASHAPYPDNTVTSGVQVLAITLEQTPFEIEMTPLQPGNIFHNKETQQLAGEIRAWLPQDVTLFWRILNDNGKEALRGNKLFHVPAGIPPASNTWSEIGNYWRRRSWQGPLTTFRIPLSSLPKGWYEAEIIAQSKGRDFVRLPMTTALLAPDTRAAGADSPYASRTASIMPPPTPELHGILMEKAGIRHITPMNSALNAGEEAYARWRVTGWQIPFMTSSATDNAEAEKEIFSKIDDYLKKWPSANSALIFHESAGGPFPPEIFDADPPQSDDATVARDTRLFAEACRTARVYRERFPQIRLIVGNSGNSLHLLAAMMRLKYPRQYIDAMGEESLGQTKMPETPTHEYGNGTALNFWFMKQLALKMGYGNLPVEPCAEWKGRMSTDIDDQTKAAWDMRDLLISFAFGCRHIRTPDLTDQGSMFYNNEYGSQGALRRYPLLYPKRSYVATAVLTRILDRVEQPRLMPINSTTAYALEFKRAGGDFVYACWLPRGEAKFEFEFEKQTHVQLVSMLGHESNIKSRNKKTTIHVSTAPGYLISPTPVNSITRLACPPPAPPVAWLSNEPVDQADLWEVRPPNPNATIKRSAANFYGIRDGAFSLRTEQDPEIGPFLKWQLIEETLDTASRAGEIRLKTPIPVPGEPDTIGVLVKGNSSWARLKFCFLDAEGEVWESSGADWPANLSVNFDGWNWICFPINQEATWHHGIYPNWIKGYWRTISGWTKSIAGNKQIDFPISLLGLSVVQPRKTLKLTEMTDVQESAIGIKAFAAGKNPGDNPPKP